MNTQNAPDRTQQGAILRQHFTEAQATTIEQLGYAHIPENHLRVFFARADELGLNPSNSSQIALIERNSRAGTTYTLQIGIAGLRRGARKIVKAEGGHYGESEWLYRGIDSNGNPTEWLESWSVKRQGFPEAAKVIVTRDGAEFAHVVMWEEAVQTYKDGNPTPMWSSKPTFMLGKNAAAGAYRKAFPDEMSDMYVDSERFDSDDDMTHATSRRMDKKPERKGMSKLEASLQKHLPPKHTEQPEPLEAEIDDTPAVKLALKIDNATTNAELTEAANAITNALDGNYITTEEAEALRADGKAKHKALTEQ